MIVDDTNLISEIIRPQPAQAVRDWLDQQQEGLLHLVASVKAEILTGIRVLPEGRRRDALEDAVAWVFRRYFKQDVLPFDDAAAEAYASLIARTRPAGQAIAVVDGQITAIALVQRATVATRDTAPFAAAGVPTINPWQA